MPRVKSLTRQSFFFADERQLEGDSGEHAAKSAKEHSCIQEHEMQPKGRIILVGKTRMRPLRAQPTIERLHEPL